MSDITEGTKKVHHFTVKKLKFISLISQFVHKSHCTDCPEEKNKKPKKHKWDSNPPVSECFVLTIDKHSRLQSSLGKVRKYVIYIKGSAEGRNKEQDERNGWYPVANGQTKRIDTLAC